LHGLSPQEHLDGGRQLMAEGYRPVAMSAVSCGDGRPVVTASVWHRALAVGGDELARRQANVAVALVRLRSSDKAWALLKHSPDPSVRSYMVHRLSPCGTDPKAIIERLDIEQDVSIRRALILSLGQFDQDRLSLAESETLMPRLVEMYRDDEDPGIHGAAEWPLRMWGQQESLDEIDQQLATGKPEGNRRWFVNGQGQTMVVIPGPVEFMMIVPENYHETEQTRRISDTFAIASKEVTREEFQRFSRENRNLKYLVPEELSPEATTPHITRRWWEAAAYCRWLSEQEGIADEQMCYPPIEEIDEGMQLPDDYLSRSGYRLPTEAEWQYACRAGAAHSMNLWFFGSDAALLGEYAWYRDTAKKRSWPVGSLKPNDFGLFDMLGNVSEWSQEIQLSHPTGTRDEPNEDVEDAAPVTNDKGWFRHGGNFYTRGASSWLRNPSLPTGLRPTRTIP